MLMPFQWLIEGSRAELVISAIWTACLLLPIGYWLGGAIRFPRSHVSATIRMTAVVIAALFFYVGMVTVPEVFGVNPASAIDWLAALAGIFSGVVLAPSPFVEEREFVGEPIVL
jgi:hypothetical protein